MVCCLGIASVEDNNVPSWPVHIVFFLVVGRTDISSFYYNYDRVSLDPNALTIPLKEKDGGSGVWKGNNNSGGAQALDKWGKG